MISLLPTLAEAHGGGLNAVGCHNDRKNGGYHCHRGSSPPPTTTVYQAPKFTRYATCKDVRSAGASIMRGEPGDHSGLDPDGDGLACNEEATVSPPVIIPISSPQISPTNIRANITPSNLTAPIEGLARVLDGDTIQIGMTRIRLYGIDAFEGEQQCKTSEDNVYGCGGRATRALEEKIADQAVSCAQRGTDAYGRTLAVCRVNSLDLSSYMARSGHALAYVKYALDYVSDEATAKEIKAGAHGGSFEAPSAYRLTRTSGAAEAQRSLAPSSECTIKGHVTKEGKRIYHLTSDPYYTRTKPENWFCSESEAEQAGFRRAGRPN